MSDLESTLSGAAAGLDWAPIDWVIAGVLVVAILRGLGLGLIRESFSIAALAGAVIAVRLGTDPLAAWLTAEFTLDWSPLTVRAACGVALAVGVLVGVVVVGRILRSGARAVGLGWADRLGGGVLGAAEGLLAAALILTLGTTWLGRDHPTFTDSKAVAALDQARATQLPPVAASP